MNGEVINRYAFVAQLAERLICNQNVVGSSPIGSFWSRTIRSSYRVVEWLIQPCHSSTLFYKEVGEGLENKMKEQKNYCVYKHTNKTNGKVYIGSTSVNFKQRFEHHYYCLSNNKHKNRYV